MFIRFAALLSIAFLFTASPAIAAEEPAPKKPDARCATLEDLYGDTGNQFQAVVGFNTREADSNTIGGTIGYGVAVDDMVISWKETRLDADITDCAGSGECADLETSTGVSFEGNSVVNITVTDRTPYSAANPVNDCNGDGDYLDAGDTNNCNGNTANDVTVKLTSTAEIAGEIAVLDETSPGSGVYKAAFPYSTFYNSPGTLFVVQSGTSLPRITARYEDRDTIVGALDERCKNALEPEQQGFITAATDVSVTTGRISVNAYTVTNVSVCSILTTKQCTTNANCLAGEGFCYYCSTSHAACTSTAQCPSGQFCTSVAGRGDQDGFADTDETINFAVQFANKAGVDVDDLTATLGTNSPNIECITRPAIIVGALANGALSNTANYLPFQFKVAPTVNRTSDTEIIQATFTLTLRSNKFDALSRAVDITLDLDLNAVGPAGVSPFLEDFEAASFGKFTLDTLDANKNTMAKSDGYRCQYNDPFGLNSNSTDNTDCFLGFTTDTSFGVNDWHIHTSGNGPLSGGMGRAFSGKQSLHLGIHKSNTSPDLDTTRLKQLDAVKTINAINMPLSGAKPELNFAHQVAFVDSTGGVSVTSGEAADRGVVEVQLATTGLPSGSWIKIYPYVNVYDQQGTDDFSNCVFDPIDDGNDEDDFFDPTDPLRRLGPSSTCYPEFTFVRQGQTDYRKTFDVNDIGAASDGPGLQGCSGVGCLPANTPAAIFNPGTWVRPRFSLVPFAGRTIRLRFLFTSIEVGATQDMGLFFGRPNVSADDGWYIDDIHIDQALGAPLTISADAAVITPIPCGACSNITAALTATPSTLSGPGQIVTLDAKGSTVDRCINGVVQFQFWADANVNGIVGDAGDILLRDWTDNSSFIDAPQLTTQYGVKARCSTDTACDAAGNAVALNVAVTCPTTGTLGAGFNQTITETKLGPNATRISWPTTASVDVIRGSLSGVATAPSTAVLKPVGVGTGFVNTVIGCLEDNSGQMNTYTDASVDPPAGSGVYYLVRGQSKHYCNESATPTWSANVAKEIAGRDTQINAQAPARTCPLLPLSPP